MQRQLETPTIRPTRIFTSDNRSRLGASNIARMKLALEPLNIQLECDFVYNMMQSNKAWKIKDIAKLIMAVNGIIQIKEPSGEKSGGKGGNTEPAKIAEEGSDTETEET